jgi:hypothetical protein
VTKRRLDPPSSESYSDNDESGAPWSAALDELRAASTFWVATVHPSGRPHVVPVLAVVSGDVLHVAAGPDTQKARNLARTGDSPSRRTARTTASSSKGRRTRSETTTPSYRSPRRTSARTGGSVEVRDGGFHAEGAPTAGPPPYHVHRVEPHRAFGFPTTGDATPTRWIFGPPPSVGVFP